MGGQWVHLMKIVHSVLQKLDWNQEDEPEI